MATKEKQAKKSRAHKESAGKNGGGGKVRLTEIQKVLLVNGGIAHRLRNQSTRMVTPKQRLSRADKQAAR